MLLPPLVKIEKDYEGDYQANSSIRAAKQQAGASPVTAEALGSGSAALVG